jgi:hypothetical protein
MTMSPVQERYARAWQEGVDTLLTSLGAAAAEIVLEEGPDDSKRAAEAARTHVRHLLKVKSHRKQELKMWLANNGPSRSVAAAKQKKGN